MSFDEYLELLRAVLKETYRVLEPGGRAVVNVANLGRRPYISLADYVTAMMEDLKFLPRGEVIWLKGRGASRSCAWGSWRSPNNPTFRDLHEYCLCFSKERWDRARKGTSTISRDDFLAATLSVWEISAESARRVSHPAPFPVGLPNRFIELYTYLDDLVLDPFVGSGSTAVAAVETGRRYIGYDISEEYLSIALERIRGSRPYTPKLVD
jgi:site-specific DNA-methyltransferase (adenine-specific)